MKTERRFLFSEAVEMRMEGEEHERRLVHWSPPWDTLSRVLWHQWIGEDRLPVRERFLPGAFADVLAAGASVVGLRDHEMSRVLGRSSAGTLELEEDDVGLRYEISLPDTVDGRDVAVLVGRGDITGSSFSFRVDEGEENETWEMSEHEGEQIILRTVLRASHLGDVGPVTFPAYPSGEGASVRAAGYCDDAVRSLERWAGIPADVELRKRHFVLTGK